MNINETYKIEKDKLSYIKLNDIQTPDLTVGNIEYSILDTNIVTIGNDGDLTAQNIRNNKSKNNRYK